MSSLTRQAALWQLRVIDLAGVLAAFLLSTVLTTATGQTRLEAIFAAIPFSFTSAIFFLLLLFIWNYLFTFFSLYTYRSLFSVGDAFRNVPKATTAGTVFVMMAATIFGYEFVHARFLVVFWVATNLISILARRRARTNLVCRGLAGEGKVRTLVVGTNERAQEFAENLMQKPEGYELVGFVDKTWNMTPRRPEYSLVADFDTLKDFLRHNVVDEVIICLPMKSLYETASHVVSACEEQGITVIVYTRLFDLDNPRLRRKHLRDDLIVTVFSNEYDEQEMAAKRLIDILISSVSLAVLSPLLLLIALSVKLTSRGPVFYVQKRLGYNKRVFDCYKFRTMVQGAEARRKELEGQNELSGGPFKIKNDPRVTPVGRLLRRLSLDELPQLVNVLKGDMSIVGPRPLPVEDVEGFEKDWPRRRFSVRPGITCLWQISGRSDVSFEKWMELDMEYIDNWSLALDLKIILRTFPAVFSHKGAY